MPVISKIRFTNVIYEGGNKRYQDEIFQFDGQNSTIVLENGGGKTVWVQTALQAILPHSEMASRRVYDTYVLSEGCAHIAIEWIINQKPRRYLVTAVSLYEQSQRLHSYKYVYEYGENDPNSIENIPYVEDLKDGLKRPVDRVEIQEYYTKMKNNNMNAYTFKTIEKYQEHLSRYHIVSEEWKKINQINGAEGGVGKFFEECKTTSSLVENLLIPVVEDSIAGDGTENFVESFEKHREHIRRYKQLKEQIEECENVLTEVIDFTNAFENWDKEVKEFNILRGKAKSMFYLIEDQYEKEKNYLDDNLEEKEIVDKNFKRLQHKKESYKMHILKKQLDAKHEKYNLVSWEFSENELKLKTKKHHLASLEYAGMRQELEDTYKEEDIVIKSIKRLDKDDSTKEIENYLEKNSMLLAGYYKNALEEISKRITGYENEEIRKEDELENKGISIKKLEKERRSLEKKKTRKETELDYVGQEIDRLRKSILDKPKDERVENKGKQLEYRLEEIENKTQEIFSKFKNLNDEQAILEINREKTIEQIDNLKDKYGEHTSDKKLFDEAHGNLIEKVNRADYRWEHIDTLYNAPFLISDIERKIETTRIELNKLIEEERRSLRWLDDYEEGQYFIADPIILGKIKNWKKEFALLLTGAEYIGDEKNNNFPYWAISLITTDKEIDKLKRYIEDLKDNLSYPICLMTEHEAGYYSNNGFKNKEEFIYPTLWKDNIYQINFIKWKEELRDKAKIVSRNKKEAEDTHNKWKDLKEEINDLEINFPYKIKIHIEENIYKTKERINQKENEKKYIYSREKEIITEKERLLEEERQLDRERNYITGKLEEIRLYKDRSKIILENKEELRTIINPQLRNTNIRMNRLEKEIKELDYILQDIKYYLREEKSKKTSIISKSLYKEVVNYKANYSSYSEEILKKERESLQEQLGKQQKGRQDLENELRTIRDRRNKIQSKIDNHTLKYPDLDKEILVLEEDINLSNLIHEVKGLEKIVKQLSNSKQEFKSQYDKILGKYNDRLEEFNYKYKKLVKWQESLEAVKTSLTKEERNLTNKLEYINKQIEKNNEDIKESFKAKNNYEIKNEKFKFLADNIKPYELKEDEKLDILYKKLEFTNRTIKSLEEGQEKLNRKEKELGNERIRFVGFCHKHIKDIKLQKLTLSGIDNLKEYKDLTKWRNNLHSRIMYTKKITEEDIRTHEDELKTFVNQINSYVNQIRDGLNEIDRKTRVKIDKKWKEVYRIKAPEWDNDRGKENIQNHILWIIDQLESGIYPEESHRKEIEKWISTKQLMAVVTEKKPIIVRCRKLTNENNLAPLASSWESSNKWSGGERWSKNMILFLGLLNYISEKTGHVIEGEKRNKVVILDNPFGEASSEHVLTPVFFVAEQLGFQIITLTAIAEGSFIRRYFPVVYSCRLRQSSHGGQIMTKEQKIQRALFKDEELPSIARLEIIDQLTLL